MTYWKPESNSMLMVSLQFLRQSRTVVPLPDATEYWEKVASKSVPLASTVTSALPGGHPDPKRETLWTLTLLGAARGATAGMAAAAPMRRARVDCQNILMEELESESKE
jgi:hypothetical protein